MPKIDLEKIEQTNATGYPPPFNEPVAGRWQRKVGEVGGLRPIIVDDLISTAGTIAATAEAPIVHLNRTAR